MSDFLDRLAARAIGSETTLAPRLPSLFESPRYLPIMPAGEQDASPPRQRATPSAGVAAETASPAAPTQPAVPSQLERSRVTPDARAEVSIPPAPLAASSLREASLPASSAPPQAPVVERPVTPTRKSKPDSPAPLRPRQTRVAPDWSEAARPASVGSLLPSPTPVFATPAHAANMPPRPTQVTAQPRFAAGRDSRGEVAREPVVHVSIGRLEVRAAAPAAAPRRREGPRPSSLDDYLRQRGDKVAP